MLPPTCTMPIPPEAVLILYPDRNSERLIPLTHGPWRATERACVRTMVTLQSVMTKCIKDTPIDQAGSDQGARTSLLSKSRLERLLRIYGSKSLHPSGRRWLRLPTNEPHLSIFPLGEEFCVPSALRSSPWDNVLYPFTCREPLESMQSRAIGLKMSLTTVMMSFSQLFA
jgi:hypothetical protein